MVNSSTKIISVASSELNPPGVSVLICTRGRRAMLDVLVSDLLRQTYPQQATEIVVVEETDKPRPLKGVRYISIPTRDLGFAHARNLAWRHATNDIVVYVDDDCRVSPDWLQKLLTPFTDLTVVGIQGGVTVPRSTNAVGWAETILGFPGGGIRRVLEAEGKFQETTVISTLNCAYRKSIIDKVGGFDEELRFGGEDYLLSKEACRYGRCLFVPDATVNHKTRGNLRNIWVWFVRRGRAEIALVRTKRQNYTTFWTVCKSSLTLKLCSLFLIGLILPKLLPFLLILTPSVYIVLQCSRYHSAWKLSRAPKLAITLLPIVKLTMDAAMDWGRFRGFAID